MKKNQLRKMISQIEEIVAYARRREKKFNREIEKLHPEYQRGAINLIHYRALRSFDLRELQKELGYLGISRMANSQLHVMASLLNVHSILKAILEDKPIKFKKRGISFKLGAHKREKNTKALLGKMPKKRRTRIMVTMPTEAAKNKKLVKEMLKAGMNCARINCAHDSPEIWKKIVKNIQEVEKKVGHSCTIAMDLAGPKIRTGKIKEGPAVVKLKPEKDWYGEVNLPLSIWIGSLSSYKSDNHLPISKEYLDSLKQATKLFFTDTRGKRRKMELVACTKNGVVAHLYKTSYVKSGHKFYFDKKRTQKAFTIGKLPNIENPIVLKTGDMLKIDRENIVGENAIFQEGKKIKPAHISCTAPFIFDEVKVGERIAFDDGKISGIIRKKSKNSLIVEITHTSIKGAKLRSDKGMNLPDTKLKSRGLTKKDKKDLRFVIKYADVVNFSFVNRPKDVKELNKELKKLNADNKLGLVVKIETKQGYNNLTEILKEAMKTNPIGVMIARGDLAVESGWENIGNEQVEILSICQAACITDIWATQVLEELAKKGLPTRAEITDAVMAQRADCIMLNKGPYIIEAIKLLDTILCEVEPHWGSSKVFTPIMRRL